MRDRYRKHINYGIKRAKTCELQKGFALNYPWVAHTLWLLTDGKAIAYCVNLLVLIDN